MLNLKSQHNEREWVIGGDFNKVKDGRERVGRLGLGSSSERNEFSDFIDDIGLVDLPYKGKKCNWYSGDAKVKSCIDRILVSNNIMNGWGAVGQFIGLRDISDHCLVWLVVNKEDWGPKPFKFNNEWFQNKDFLAFLEKEWKDMIVTGIGDFALKDKLRAQMGEFKHFWEDRFGDGGGCKGIERI